MLEETNMKSKKWLIALCSVAILLIYVTTLGNGVVGVSQNKLEEDARKSQKINETWVISKDVTNEMAVMLFYDKELDDHTFSVYLNRNGFSYGYFFVNGGSLSSLDSGVQGFTYQDNGMALFSMNTKNIAEVKMESNQNVVSIKIDPLKPFTIIIPLSVDEVSLYNSNGEIIPIDNISGY